MGGTGLGSICFEADFEYICEELGLCKPDIPANLCNRNGKDNADERCSVADQKACIEDWKSCIVQPDFSFCTTFEDMCFPPAETFVVDDIAPIAEDQKMDDYGAPFFERPHTGGSAKMDLTDKVKIVTCEFELIEPMTVVDKIIASTIEKRKLPLFPGSEFRPAVTHGARVFSSYQAKGSKLLAEYKNKPKLVYPEAVESSVESAEEKKEKEEFEQIFKAPPQATVGELMYLGENEAFNLLELEGEGTEPYEIVYSNKAAFA